MHYKFPIKFFTVLLTFFLIALLGCGDNTDQQGEMKKDDRLDENTFFIF